MLPSSVAGGIPPSVVRNIRVGGERLTGTHSIKATTMRIALGVEYDGRNFRGWETQREARTVQTCLELALAGVANHPVKTVCAGRTDARVHALGQVVHFDSDASRPLHAWMLGANAKLPPDVSVIWAHAVSGDFSARFSARARSYRYLILDRRARPALYRARVAWGTRPLDVEGMREAGGYLLGEHDFSAFRAAACQARSSVRTLYQLDVVRHGAVIAIEVRANAFLQHMVRNIAGVLIAVGMQRRPPDWAARVLAGRMRALGGVTAPPDGLYLVGVEYPPTFGLPAVSSGVLL